MIIKYILLVAFAITLNANYNPKKITKNNLNTLRAIDGKLYELAFEKETYNYKEISNFIYQNLVYDLDFSRFKVLGSTSARLTYQDENENQFTNEGNRIRAQVMLTYPFFDAKESNARIEKIMSTKQKIITQVKKYFSLKAKHKNLEIEKLILIRVETRAKSRKLQAVGSFDEWLKVIRDIKKVNLDLSLSEIELSEAKQILLTYVRKSKRQPLKEML